MTEKASKQPKYDFFKHIYFAIYNHFVNSNPDKDGFGVDMLKYTLAVPFCLQSHYHLGAYNEKPTKEELDYAFIFFNPFKESNYYLFIVDMGMVVEFIDGRINVLFYEEHKPHRRTSDELIEEMKKLLLSIVSSGDKCTIPIEKLDSLQAQINVGIKMQDESFEQEQYLKELALENLKRVSKNTYFPNGFKDIKCVYHNYLNKRVKSLLKDKVVKNSQEVLKEILGLENCDPYLTDALPITNLIKYGILDQFFYNDKMVINSLQLELDIQDFEDDIYLVEISENGFDKNRLDELNVDYLEFGNQIKRKALDHDFIYSSYSSPLNSIYRFKKADIIPANTFFIPFSNPATDRVILGYSLDEDFNKEVYPDKPCGVGGIILPLHWHKQEVSSELFKFPALFCAEPSEHFSADAGFYPVIGLGFAKKFQNILQEKFESSLKRFIDRYKPARFISEEDFLSEMREIYRLLSSRNELKIKSDNEQLEYFRELADFVFANNEVL